MEDYVDMEKTLREQVNRDIESTIRHPDFSHAKTGDRLYRGFTLIYYRSAGPTGVALDSAWPTELVEPLLRTIRNDSPLSPTEVSR